MCRLGKQKHDAPVMAEGNRRFRSWSIATAPIFFTGLISHQLSEYSGNGRTTVTVVACALDPKRTRQALSIGLDTATAITFGGIAALQH
jgi:hypothetical protein